MWSVKLNCHRGNSLNLCYLGIHLEVLEYASGDLVGWDTNSVGHSDNKLLHRRIFIDIDVERLWSLDHPGHRDLVVLECARGCLTKGVCILASVKQYWLSFLTGCSRNRCKVWGWKLGLTVGCDEDFCNSEWLKIILKVRREQNLDVAIVN